MIRRDPKRRRGIFIITTLMVITFLVILSTTLLSSALQNMASAGSFDDRELALHAATAGLAYIQARLEENSNNFAPDPAGKGHAPTDLTDAPTTYEDQVSGAMSVTETGWNVFGIINNQNETGTANPAEQLITTCFRVTFQKSYTTAPDSENPTIVGAIPASVNQTPSEFVSFNNINQPAALQGSPSFSSFDKGASYHTVPQQSCDVIVEGYSVRPDGAIRARRVVEAMLAVSQFGNFPQIAAISNAEMDLTVTDPTGNGKVNVSGGLASSTSSIDFLNEGPTEDFGSLYHGPGVTLGVGQSATYNQSGTVPVSPAPAPTPPPVTPAQLPPVKSNATVVNAGMYVIFDGNLFHYPLNFQALDSSGNPIPNSSQPWAPGSTTDPTVPPTFNGVKTDTPTGVAIQGLALANATNTLIDGTLTDPTTGKPVPGAPGGSAAVDIKVQTINPDPSNKQPNEASLIDTLTLVVPPQTVNNSAANPSPSGATSGTTPLVDPTDASRGVGVQRPSAQLFFGPGPADGTPQVQVPGAFTILGDVVGQGSVVAQGANPSPAGPVNEGDITVVGKSSVDPKPDSGVGLFAQGSINILPLDQTQLPQTVNLATGAPPPPIAASSNSAALADQTTQEINSAIAQSVLQNLPPGSTQLNLANFPQNLPPGFFSNVQSGNTAKVPDPADVDPGTGQPKVKDLHDVLKDLGADQNGDAGETQNLVQNFLFNLQKTEGGVTNPVVAIPPPNGNAVDSLANPALGVSPTGLADSGINSTLSGTSLGSSSGTSSGTSSGSSSTAPVAPPPPDQTFGGLAYANVAFNVGPPKGVLSATGSNGSISLSGVMIVNKGGISLNANSISLQYSPGLLGAFGNILGQSNVTLVRQGISIF